MQIMLPTNCLSLDICETITTAIISPKAPYTDNTTTLHTIYLVYIPAW